MKKLIGFTCSHLLVGFAGFALGIYLLPILTAPKGPSVAEVSDAAGAAEFSGEFRRDLKGSDFLHWGEGSVSIGKTQISLMGEVSPGPDYKLYLSPQFVETEAEFAEVKQHSVRVGEVKTFENFIVPLSGDIDPRAFKAVVVWCETFGEFITAARYQ